MYGKWPIPAFLQCPPELQLAWWQSEGTTREEIHAKLVTTVSDSKINESVKETKGQFLPLSVWRKRGFDTEKIKANTPPEHVRQHDVLGATYKVDIEEEMTSEENAKM